MLAAAAAGYSEGGVIARALMLHGEVYDKSRVRGWGGPPQRLYRTYPPSAGPVVNQSSILVDVAVSRPMFLWFKIEENKEVPERSRTEGRRTDHPPKPPFYLSPPPSNSATCLPGTIILEGGVCGLTNYCDTSSGPTPPFRGYAR